MAIDPKDYPNIIKNGLKANDSFDRFFYRFKVDGKTKKGIFDYSDRKGWNKKERIVAAERDLADTKETAKQRINDDATVDDMVKIFYESLPEGHHKDAISSYYDRKVKKALGHKKAKDVLPMHIQSLVNKLIKQGDAPRTALTVLHTLRPAFKLARANRIVVFNPCDDVKIKLPKTKKIVVNASERLKLIYDTIMRIYAKDPYYRSFFLLALQGRRKGEIISLRWENISFEYDYYFLPSPKNDQEQKIFLPPNVKACFEEFRKDRGWVFESPVNPGKRLHDAKRQTIKLKNALGEWFTMHYTRNVMVSAMAEQGVDAIYMSGALGHNDPNTITKYLTMNYLQGSKIASDMIQRG